jgi:hypothetical protein
MKSNNIIDLLFLSLWLHFYCQFGVDVTCKFQMSECDLGWKISVHEYQDVKQIKCFKIIKSAFQQIENINFQKASILQLKFSGLI